MAVTHTSDAEIEMIRELVAERRWNREGLRAKLAHFDRQAFDGAFASLVIAGVARADRFDIEAAPSLRYLADAGLLALDAPNGAAPDREMIDRILAREALQEYARHPDPDRDDLPPLIDRAAAAGLELETIAALAEGRSGVEH